MLMSPNNMIMSLLLNTPFKNRFPVTIIITAIVYAFNYLFAVSITLSFERNRVGLMSKRKQCVCTCILCRSGRINCVNPKTVNTLIWRWHFNCAMTNQIRDQYPQATNLITVTACGFSSCIWLAFSSQRSNIPEIVLVFTVFGFAH